MRRAEDQAAEPPDVPVARGRTEHQFAAIHTGSGVSAGHPDALDLTPAQRSMWFAEQLSDAYSVNIAQYLDIRYAPGALDHDLLAECSLEVGKRLESPYVRLAEVDGVPMQRVDLSIDHAVDIIDFRSDFDPAARAMRWMEADYQRTVDLVTDKLVVSTLLRVADDRTFWYTRGHHIVIDGYAALTLVRMTVDRYNAARGGRSVVEKPFASLSEIVQDEKLYGASTRRETDRQHWRERVEDLPVGPTLSEAAAQTELSAQNRVQGVTLDGDVQERLVASAKLHNSSTAVVLVAAVAAFFGRMTDTDDVVLTLPVTGRASAKIKRAGGMLSNVLPIRLTVDERSPVAKLIAAAQVELTGALRHQRYRSDDIRRDADLPGDSHNFGPVVNMMFFDQPVVIDGATVDYRILTSGIVEDMLVNLYQASPGSPIRIDLHGNPNRFSDVELARHVDRFARYLRTFVEAAQTDGTLEEVQVLSDAEWTELSAVSSGPAARAELLADSYSRVAAKYGDRLAVRGPDGVSLTYAELDRRSSQMARWLVLRGVGPEVLVGLALGRSAELLVCIWAVAKTGGGYVPLDPDYPSERIAFMVADAGISVVLTTSAYSERLPIGATSLDSPETIAEIDELDSSPVTQDSRLAPVHLENVAYVIYTSGSTGRPKGVAVSYRGLHNFGRQQLNRMDSNQNARVLGSISPGFDASITELVLSTVVGGALIYRPPEAVGGDELTNFIAEQKITHAVMTPSVLASVNRDAVPTLHWLITGGEAIPQVLADRWGSRVSLFDGYGPTEASVVVAINGPHRPGDRVLIGKPIAGVELSVLDRRLRPVPVGMVGELYAAGVPLARGYWRRASLTAHRYVANPYRAGERLYRTGDRVRWVRDRSGELALEYLGRSDTQVKLHGLRIEPGEIEMVLANHPAVTAAAVVGIGEPKITSLAAYVVTTHDVPIAELREHLAASVPAQWIPASIITLDRLPVTTSGKLDRAALPAPQADDQGRGEFIAPTTDLERHLVAAVEELLGAEGVGLQDNIFRMGADSLVASRFAAGIRRELDVEVSLTDVFETADLAQLATRLQHAATIEGQPRLVAAARPNRIPLSYAQTRLWFINRMDPSGAAYNMPGAVHLGPNADVAALRRAIKDVAVRHESLRTIFPAHDGEPVQQILDTEHVDAEFELTTSDVAPDQVRAAVAELANDGFDLLNQVPLRASLLRVVESGHVVDHVFVVVLHHIAGDGASMEPLIVDFLTAYQARRVGREPDWVIPLPVQYADFTLWQREVLGDRDDPDSLLAGESAYWETELAGAPELLRLPTDRSRPQVASGRGDYVDTRIDAETVARIREVAAGAGVTVFSFLQVAWGALLARLSGSDEVVVGTAVAGRDQPELGGLIGMFVNTVALRMYFDPAQSVLEQMSSAHKTRTQALAHSAIPFEQVVDALAPGRTLSYSPLVQVMLSMQKSRVTDLLDNGDEHFRFVDARVPGAKYDLSLSITEFDTTDHFALEFSYATDLFDRTTIEELAAAFRRVVTGMVDDVSAPIGSIDVVAPAELNRLRAPVVAAAPQHLRELIRDGEEIAPAASTAVSGASRVTWQVFSARTNQLARELIERGAGPGQVVAVSISRSLNSVLAVVAVMKTGAAFVSIDTRHPIDRRAAMLADSDAVIGIAADAESVVGIDDAVDWVVLEEQSTEWQLAGHSGAPIADGELRGVARVDDLAYLIYTSGSTGVPKAAAISHRGIANFVRNLQERFAIDSDSRVLHVASPSFDASVLELLMALPMGAELVVADADTFAGADLEALIASHGVTHAMMTPATLATLDPEAVPTVTTVMSGGEACPLELVRRWVGAGGRRFFNLYGPTEVTVWATVDGPMALDDGVTIGTPLGGVGAVVLDRGLRPVPDGVAGMLYLTGPQLARGYHHRSALTAMSFVANPFAAGERMYRTGDMVTRRPDGKLIYNGRDDFQLKIRGLRIEPGEVDAVLTSHKGVANALSLGVPGPSGDAVLVSYVAPRDGYVIDTAELTALVAGSLPAYMVPTVIRVIDEFPRTPIGKIDRRALPAVDFTSDTELVAPRTQLEAVVADVFAQVLGVNTVSIHDGFFELGGNSLSATKVTARVAAALNRQIPVKTLFEAPTVAQLAEQLSAQIVGHSIPPLVARARAELVPVTPVQRGMWLVNRADPDSAAYNVTFALRLDGELVVDALVEALYDLVKRHESMRTSYPMVNGEPTQVIVPADVVAAQLNLSVQDCADNLEDAIARETSKAFDVTTTVPVRISILRKAADEHYLVCVIHHISADGSSVAPMARDLMSAYAARRAGRSPCWRPLSVQYADFALWQAERLAASDESGVSEHQRQLDYWISRLEGAPERIDLPSDRPRPRTPSFTGGVVDFMIGEETARAVDSLARTHNTTTFMVMHAAYAVLLARLAGARDVVIGTPYAGRGDQALDDVVGMFVNTLALRTSIRDSEPFVSLLGRVRRDDLADMANADVAFDAIATKVRPTPAISYNPIFQVMFAFQNIDFPPVELDGLTVSPIRDGDAPAKVDLELNLYPNDPLRDVSSAAGAMRGQFVFARDLFEAESIERIAKRYVALLESIVADPESEVADLSIAIDDDVNLVGETAGEDSPSASTPLGELVRLAAARAPEGVAVASDGLNVTFGGLTAMMAAMMAALPNSDDDSILTMALMSSAPGLAAGGSGALDDVLGSMRAAAVRLIGTEGTMEQEESSTT